VLTLDAKEVHEKVLNSVNSIRFGNNPFISQDVSAVRPESNVHSALLQLCSLPAKDSEPFVASVKEDVESWRNCLLEIKAGYEVASGKRVLTLFVTRVPLTNFILQPSSSFFVS